MAINIFEGGKKSSSSARVASASSRAKAAKEALAEPAETSDNGSVAVSTSGTLGKIGGFLKKAIPVAAKFLPGVAGSVAKVAESAFNDPEWWQGIPGDGISTNAPLSYISIGTMTGIETTRYRAGHIRPAFAVVASCDPVSPDPTHVFNPSEQAITQYLMPNIRRSTNAIPLQSATSYRTVLSFQVAAYALWRQLLKYDYILKHGHTYIPNMNESAFPILQVENAAWLQSAIARLEEYLESNVRLPHTLCEYVSWRFGRVYQCHNSAKSAFITYDVISPVCSIATFNTFIQAFMTGISANTATQQANTDLYNTYYDHVYHVEIKDDTQFKFDPKEWMLRQNLDLALGATEPNRSLATTLNPVVIDSSMDNPTTFMASTVSTRGTTAAGGLDILFPCYSGIYVYVYLSEEIATPDAGTSYMGFYAMPNKYTGAQELLTQIGDTHWWAHGILPTLVGYPEAETGIKPVWVETDIGALIANLTWCKALDIYNAQQYVVCAQAYISDASLADSTKYAAIDLTAIAYDTGTVDDTVLGNEHVFAFANLVDVNRKTSMSYRTAEKLVTRDVANMVNTLDVATAK